MRFFKLSANNKFKWSMATVTSLLTSYCIYRATLRLYNFAKQEEQERRIDFYYCSPPETRRLPTENPRLPVKRATLLSMEKQEAIKEAAKEAEMAAEEARIAASSIYSALSAKEMDNITEEASRETLRAAEVAKEAARSAKDTLTQVIRKAKGRHDFTKDHTVEIETDSEESDKEEAEHEMYRISQQYSFFAE